MNIISGASGQVGSAVAADLVKKGLPVKGIIRDEKKAVELRKIGADVAVGDVHDEEFLKESFQDGKTLFVLTPENGEIEDILGDNKIILDSYRKAIIDSPIKKIVGLSSMGAQYKNHSGNLQMSYMLEHQFLDLDIKQIFIRPAYYYSNWLPYLKQAEEEDMLRTFYPVDLSIPMVSPHDVAKLLANVIADDYDDRKIYEIEGPAWLSPNDVAEVFSEILGKKIVASQIPKDDWPETLAALKFSKDGIKNFIEMTETVVSGKSKPEGNGTIAVKGEETLKQFIKQAMVKNE